MLEGLDLQLISKVHIRSLISGQVRCFRFVFVELGSDSVPNMWPQENIQTGGTLSIPRGWCRWGFSGPCQRVHICIYLARFRLLAYYVAMLEVSALQLMSKFQINSLICGHVRLFRFVVIHLGSDIEPNMWPTLSVSDMQLISKVQIRREISGHVRCFRFVFVELGSDFVPNMWPQENIWTGGDPLNSERVGIEGFQWAMLEGPHLYLFSQVQIIGLLCGHVRGFSFVVNEQVSD